MITNLENTPKGDSLPNGAAENAVRDAEEMIRTWKMSVKEKLKAVLDNKACDTSVARGARRSVHHEVQKWFMMARKQIRGFLQRRSCG